MRDQSLADHLASNLLGLVPVINEMNTALESSFLEMTLATTTSVDLRLDDTSAGDTASDCLCFLWAKSDFADRDGHLVRVEQSTSLVFV